MIAEIYGRARNASYRPIFGVLGAVVARNASSRLFWQSAQRRRERMPHARGASVDRLHEHSVSLFRSTIVASALLFLLPMIRSISQSPWRVRSLIALLVVWKWRVFRRFASFFRIRLVFLDIFVFFFAF